MLSPFASKAGRAYAAARAGLSWGLIAVRLVYRDAGKAHDRAKRFAREDGLTWPMKRAADWESSGYARMLDGREDPTATRWQAGPRSGDSRGG